jgi:hypothetical protein
MIVVLVGIGIAGIQSRIRTEYLLGDIKLNNEIESNKELHRIRTLNKSLTINQTIDN